MHKEQTVRYNYNPIIIILSTHSTERPFLNLSVSRGGWEFSNTICVWLSRRIISRLSRRQWQLLSRASFPFYYGIWQGAGPTPQSCSLTVYCGAITSLPIWSTPSLHFEQCLGGEKGREIGWKGIEKRWEQWKEEKRKNVRWEAGKGSNAKPVESEHRHWGNQKSSEPVCVVGVLGCVCVHAFMFAVLLLAQFYPNKAHNKPQNKHGYRQFPNSQHTCHNGMGETY